MKSKLVKTSFYISINELPRQILSFSETKKGDIYVRLYSGTQIGIPPDEHRIRNNKYSIHPTLTNSEYNMVKKTLTLENGLETTSVLFTNAIKSVDLYSNLFSCRMSNLQAPLYDIDQDDLQDAVSLGKLNVEKNVLILSLLVTNRNTVVPDFIGNAYATQFTIGETKFVIVRTYQMGPALESAWTLGNFTFDPRNMEDEEAKMTAENRMKASSLEGALENINFMAEHLMENYLITLHNSIDDEQTKQEIREMIDANPKIAGMHLAGHKWEKKN